MADVADVTFADAERAEKRNDGHDGDDPLHFDGDGNRKKISAAVREQNGAGDHDSEDRPGRANGRVEGIWLSPKMGHGVNKHVDETCAGTGQKIVAEEPVAAPDEFEFTAEHPEKKHVEDYVRDMRDIVKEEVSEWLPDAAEGKDRSRNKAEPFYKPVVSIDSAIPVDEGLQNENGEIGDEEEFHTRSDVKIEADAVARDAAA